MKKQPQSRQEEPLDRLREMVRLGQLFKVQTWIGEGNPVYLEDNKRPSVLHLAVDSGFHSLVEVLAGAWPRQDGLNWALESACEKRRLDMAATLMELGADITKVPLAVIAGTCDIPLMTHVLDRWQEFDQENGLYEIVTSMPRPLTGLIKERQQAIPNSQMQLARAMKHFALKDHPLWVGLTVWMGGDARLACPSPDEDDEVEENWTTPLAYAVSLASNDAVRAMQVTARDNATDLLKLLHIYRRDGIELLRYLLSRGAAVNDKPGGGSSVLEKVLAPYWIWEYSSIDAGLVEELVGHGAKFCPDQETRMRDIRRALGELSVPALKGIVYILLATTTDDALLKLLNAPKLKEKLALKGIPQLKHFLARLRQQRAAAPPSEPLRRKAGRPPKSNEALAEIDPYEGAIFDKGANLAGFKERS